jgi:acetyl-CoA carboxylase carboxyl transferase subunit beta
MKEHIKEFLQKYDGKTGDEIATERYDRFRAF